MAENLFTSIASENFKPAIHPEFPVFERDKFVDVSIHHSHDRVVSRYPLPTWTQDQWRKGSWDQFHRTPTCG